jgi:hypothetical protein
MLKACEADAKGRGDSAEQIAWLEGKVQEAYKEGYRDAISVLNTGRRCLAVLSNNPQQLKPWLSTLPCTTIALCDGDKAGEMLARVCDKKIVLPDGVDANDMSKEDLIRFLNKEETK